ncbi:uncharacterized protein BXZ73DRAFT_82589 [Epithele typhae]|uniref:uncharacterized protein n=1 Tax=Epithele typhae TaxID=378194 RepID=UPI002007C528|nr:uncharacterized protein BXZ73DRAFT_82589 [Epithele typhae]KAH9911815.1 hypothetical protein BXZ73DRAFT_82589 [Epithele typhae]
MSTVIPSHGLPQLRATSMKTSMVWFSARKCNEHGQFIDEDAPPPQDENPPSYHPWQDRPSFEFTVLNYHDIRLAKEPLNQLLRIWAAKSLLDGHPDAGPPFQNVDEMLETIDNAMFGEAQWQVYKRSKRPRIRGAMLVPIILGADKTTVSVATGNQDFIPFTCLSAISTTTCVAPTARVSFQWHFSQFPKLFALNGPSTRPLGRAQHILFTTPVGRDELGVLSAMSWAGRAGRARSAGEFGVVIQHGQLDMLSPSRCRAMETTSRTRTSRFREHTEELLQTFDPATLWDVYGLIKDVEPYTYYFPRADIHELLSPDILHQTIKGTFKDHLVTWVIDYITENAATPHEARNSR